MNQYLENFSYRGDNPLVDLTIACLIILSMTLVIVGAQVITAATANPVKGLGSDS